MGRRRGKDGDEKEVKEDSREQRKIIGRKDVSSDAKVFY